MSKTYNPNAIEAKWHKRWKETELYRAKIDHDKEKFYAMTMLPYPSGNLHIGHWYAMTPSDARARYLRMKGYNVMFPIGFDSFGLPAENAAIKNKIHPRKWTYANIDHERWQMENMGMMVDVEREIVSSDPEYYRWTQWFFLQFYKNGLAYRKHSAVNFCPQCNTTLAREQVWGDDRHCERCGTPVIMKDLEQWYFRITNYAEELLDFSKIDWPDKVKLMQTNWIGKSEGAHVTFHTEAGDPLEVFTTRPDTLWGATFMVLAPEHPLVEKISTGKYRAGVDAYVEEASRKTEIDRTAEGKEKTGVFTGGYAVNPVNGAKIPIWIADYVLITYGSGAIMAVPGHDERDFEFARKFDLEIIPVIQPEGENFDGATMEEAYIGPGEMINSDQFNGTFVSEAKGRKNPGISAVIDWLEAEEIGTEAVNYRMRDWLISRQRYWGAPIPMIYCDKCGIVPVPEDELPVLLPDDVEFMPTGESPLKFHEEYLHTTCPRCGGPATRETDTMDTFMCSSWYQYGYLSPKCEYAPFDPVEAAYWLPVDRYTGGIEHATMHLLYTRFFTKAMRDCGVFSMTEEEMIKIDRKIKETEFDEPMLALYNQGMILGEDREKMSKSRGNVIDPDNLVEKYGADAVRAYLMFAFKWDQGGPWDSQGMQGPIRWLNDAWTLVCEEAPGADGKANPEGVKALRRKTHQTIAKVTQDIEDFSFNTAIAALMELKNKMFEFRNTAVAKTEAWDEAVRNMILLMAPIVPHITEEMWEHISGEYSVHTEDWPEADPTIAKEETITLIVQVNGKVRERIEVPADVDQEEAKELAFASETVQKFMGGKEARKVIVVPGKLVNIVV